MARRALLLAARFTHNCIAHPLLFWTGDSSFAVWLHDVSSPAAHAKR